MSIKAFHWTDPMDDGLPPSADLPADLPEWLVARRERSTLTTSSKADPALKTAVESPATRISVDPTPTKVAAAAPILPPPITKTLLKPNSKGGVPLVEVKETNLEEHPPESNWVIRWLTNNSTIGFATSLFFHTVVLLALAFIVISNVSKREEISLFGVANEGDDIGSEMFIDTTLPIDGGESAPLRMNDVAQAAELNDTRGPLDGMGGGSFTEMKGAGLGGKGHGEGESGDGNSIGPPALRVPGHAQNKGSFSAWTEPRDPDPGQDYFIVIQIRLPRSIKKYRASDLSGLVSGTDKYLQKIPKDPTEVYPIDQGSVDIRILVPGGAKKVQDTIQIASKLLKEKQTFKIEF